MLKVNDIHIKDIGPISDLKLNFNPSVNIICGTNSVGKTTVLECISHLFSFYSTQILKRKAKSEEGSCTASISNDGQTISFEYKIDQYRPVESIRNQFLDASLSKKVLSIKTSRNFSYQTLEAIKRDPNRELHHFSNDIEHGINISDAKNWFVNRYMFIDKQDSLKPEQIENYNLAMRCFSTIDPGMSFKRVMADTFDIILDAPMGEIYFEYLSSGYKSLIFILFSIIKEIEFRFKDPAINARDFDGIILIDEVDAHLHPSWQGKIMRVLTEIFPNAQFFVTTHSPHVLQSADPGQIIALEIEEGNIRQRSFGVSEYGFSGWSVEEILNDVMGMEDTRSDVYHETIRIFDRAMDDEDRDTSVKAYLELRKMLHPSNPLRKVLEIQMAGAGFLSDTY